MPGGSSADADDSTGADERCGGVPCSGTVTSCTTGPQFARTTAIDSIGHTVGAGDVTTVSITTEARERAFSSGLYSAWSPWGTPSAAATATGAGGCPTGFVLQPCPGDPTQLAAVYPAGYPEPFRDINGNGSWDPGESFTDLNGDLTWTADLGGQPTGECYPPGHICLQPGEVCLPMGS